MASSVAFSSAKQQGLPVAVFRSARAMRAVHVVLVIVMLACLPAGMSVAQDRVYVAEYKFEDPALRSMNLDGTDVVDLFDAKNPLPTSGWLLVGLALDEFAGKVYWLHGSTPGVIRRADLDGSGQEVLVSGLKIPRGLALDPDNGKMYWSGSPPAGNAGGMVQRSNMDGTGVETVYLDPDYDPVSSKIGRPRVDAVNGWVYFASNDRILRTNLDGPPFEVFTVVTGVSTARAVALDVANDHIYWIGADTIEDVVCRANLDNTGFTVVHDFSPDSGNSNGLSDIILDLDGLTFLVCDDLRDDIDRGALDGSSLETVYTSPEGFSPSAMALNAGVDQPFVDCNNNFIADIEDVLSGSSDDCNGNAIPDECEDDPCAPVELLVDQSSDLTYPGSQLGGAPENQRWVIFQPFDVGTGGWDIASIQVNGVTWTYRPEGFTATVFPDDGGDYPDESQPLVAGDAFFRFAPEWVTVPVDVTLPEGRHWIRLTANDENNYLASVSTVSDGPLSFSRSGLGNDFPGKPPIALRIVSGEGGADVTGSGAAPGFALRLESSNPSTGFAALRFSIPRDGSAELCVYGVRGTRVRTLLRGVVAAGTHAETWDGRDERGVAVGSGVYLVRLEASGRFETLKLMWIR